MANEVILPSERNGGRRSDEKYCSACARLMHAGALFCPDCGAPQGDTTALSPISADGRLESLSSGPLTGHFCHGCGKGIHISATSCPHCGAVNRAAGIKGSKDKSVAGLFALLLGGIGAHHFYLGNVGLGILYLIFCWTFIPMIIAFIEGIIYLTQSDENFAKKYP